MGADKKADTENSHLTWETIGRKRLENYHIFSMYEVERKTADGKVATFYEVDAPHWVTIIPCIHDPELGECFLMVRQFRHGNESITLEFPAGMVDAGEDPVAGAKRELLEETGYLADTLEKLGTVSPNPAFMNNSVTTYLAENMQLVDSQNLDELEMIDLVPVPVPEVIEKMGKGEYNNGIMMMSLALYLRRKGMIKS